MAALKAEDVGAFTSKLFVKEDFDGFLVKEIIIVTFSSFTTGGHIKQGYYLEKELEEKQTGDFSSWKMLKPICFSLTKGKKLPGSFHIVLCLSSHDAGQFVGKPGTEVMSGQIRGLYLNIRYEDDASYCVTGASLNFSTLDKMFETEWDNMVRNFMRSHEIVCI